MNKKNKAALLVIDVQNDFCPGGSLAVPKGDKIIPAINDLAKKFHEVIATQDWHPRNHISFASNHPGKKINEEIKVNGINQVLWPDHCIKGTKGASFHPKLDTTQFDLILRKGNNPKIDSYSAFQENDKKTITGLNGYLKNLEIKNVYIAGLALDYCVYFSAMDANELGYNTFVIKDATKGINKPEGSIEKALNRMKEKGVKIIKSLEISF